MTICPAAVVTGSSKGIGKEIAVTLASAGYRVVLHGRTESETLKETLAELRSRNLNVDYVVGDFAEFADEDFRSLVDEAFRVAGVGLRVWVNNAGVDVLTGPAKQLGFSAKLQQVWHVDVRSTLLLSRLVAERWGTAANTDSSLINIGWDQATTGLPGDSGQMFAASKGAIMAMTAALAKSYAPNVRVNCVAPGWIKTDWGQAADSTWDSLVRKQSLKDRWGAGQDIANAVKFLASTDSSFVNGQVINVNGGLSSASDELIRKLS